MRPLEPDNPADGGYVFWWLLGGIILGGAVLGRVSTEFEVIDWALLVIASLLLTMFGERIGYQLGYMRGKWEAEQASKQKD